MTIPPTNPYPICPICHTRPCGHTALRTARDDRVLAIMRGRLEDAHDVAGEHMARHRKRSGPQGGPRGVGGG